jgi:exonuclease III
MNANLQKYIYPSAISGKKYELIGSYLRDINISNRNFSKKQGTTRLLIYNVRKFSLRRNLSRILIYNLIRRLKPDVTTFIEYMFLNENEEIFNKYFNYSCSYQKQYNTGIKTFAKIPIQCFNDELEDLIFDNDTRGFTHIKVNNYNLVSIHLNVEDNTGKTREKEIKTLIKYIKKHKLQNVILSGDFNAMNTNLFSKEYTKILNEEFNQRTGLKKIPTSVFKLLKDNEFIDMFDVLNKEHPKFSCWSGYLVDYAYIYKPTWTGNLINVDLYYCPYSDHLPIIIDLE